MLELMEAICNPLAEIGCEDILHITQSRFEGGMEFSPPLFWNFFLDGVSCSPSSFATGQW